MRNDLISADLMLRGVQRVANGLSSTSSPVERRLLVEFCSGAPGGMIAVYLAVESRHIGLVHDGPAQDCDACLDHVGAFFNGAVVEMR